VNWLDGVREPTLRDVYAEVYDLAEWSEWLPLAAALRGAAPREPGVYLLRDPSTGSIRYVGMAGERAGSGRPQGLLGRLSDYRFANGAAGGLTEAALDRALADPDWVEAQLRDLRAHGPKRATDWARDAVIRLDLEVSWAVSADRADALYLERQVSALLSTRGLWNR
jgi:hypothetical protein